MADPVPNAIPWAMVLPIPLNMPPPAGWVAGGAAAGRVAGADVDTGRRWVAAGLDPNMEPEEEEREDPPRRERCC